MQVKKRSSRKSSSLYVEDGSCPVGSFEQPLCVQPWAAVQGSVWQVYPKSWRIYPKNIVVFALSLQEIINISDRIRACCESACDVRLEQFTAAKYVISGWAYVEKQTEYGLHPFLCLLWKDNEKNAAEGLLCSGLELFCQR